MFLKRGRPGGDSYCTTVGGSVEPADADLEAALRREAMEEVGATIGPATEFLLLTEPGGTITVEGERRLVGRDVGGVERSPRPSAGFPCRPGSGLRRGRGHSVHRPHHVLCAPCQRFRQVGER
nr:NUDIX hydrolase [Streptomyces sp. NBC_00886]